jgi:transposase InsO family protein
LQYSNIKKFISSCLICCRFNHSGAEQAISGALPAPSRPWEIVHIDWVGPFPLVGEMRYIIIMIDRLTGYIEAEATSSQTAEVAVDFFEKVSFRYSSILYLVSDRGSQFLSHTFSKMCSLLRTKQLLTSAYHPQTNGKVERANKTLQQVLAKMCSNGGDWPSILPICLHFLRTTPSGPYLISPHEALFGSVPVTLLETILPPEDAEVALGELDRVKLLRSRTSEISLLLQNTMQLISENRIQNRGNQGRLKVGEVVFVKVPGLVSKLQEQFSGPYSVVRISPSGAAVQVKRHLDGRLFSVNIKRVKCSHPLPMVD